MAYVGWQAGQRVTAGGLNTMVGAWTDYPVAWTAATTAPNIGNGSVVGRYQLAGDTCQLAIVWSSGSTTTYGSGQYAFSVPFQAAAGPAYIAAGHGIVGGGGGYRGDLNLLLLPAGTVIQPWAATSRTNTVLAGVMGTGLGGDAWASGSVLRMNMTYQIA